MTYPYQGEYAESLIAQGMARAVLHLLDTRGIAVPEETREHVIGCRDVAVLDEWLRRALKAESVEDVFG